jgi:AraC-like DNA-binding protein
VEDLEKSHRGRPTLLERLNIDLDELVRLYAEEGTLTKLATRLGCSRTTVKKYLSDIEKDPTPWKVEGKLKKQERSEGAYVRQQVNKALATKSFWLDIQNRRIPREAIEAVYVEFSKEPKPLVPIYGVTKNGMKFIALFKIPDEGHQEPEESS